MKSKIIKTIFLLLTSIIVVSILELITYGNSQLYSNLAPSQVNSDTTYYLMKTNINDYIIYVKLLLTIIFIYLMFEIWKIKIDKN